MSVPNPALHLVLPIVAPLAAAILCLALYRSARGQRLVSLATAVAVNAYLALGLWPQVRQGTVVTVQMGNWPAPYGITLAADLLTLVMLALAAITGLAVLVYAAAWLDGDSEETFFYPLYNILLMGVSGAFLTGDIFNLYVFFEVMLLSSFALLALGGGRRRIEGTVKYLAISQVSSALFLLGAGLLYGIAGTLNMADLARKLAAAEAGPYTAVIALLFLVAFGVKAAIFPLFFWLPASYHTAKTPITAFFGGLLTKVGIYALFRTYALLFPAQWQAQRPLLLALAALTMITGVLGAVAQGDIKRLLSFHIVSQIGYLIMGLGLASGAGLAAAIYFMIHIVLVKTSLFLVAGLAERATGTTDLYGMGGLLRRCPSLAALFLAAALSLAGLPPLSGFVGKFGLVLAGLRQFEFAAVAAALGVSLLTLFSMVKIWTQAFMKPAPTGLTVPERPQPVLFAATLGLVAASVLAALFAGPLYGVCQQAAQQLTDTGPYLMAVLGG